MRRFVLVAAVASMGCPSQTSQVVDSDFLEDRIAADGNGPYRRGTQAIGESCESLLDCDTLTCIGPVGQSLCTQPCTAAVCPPGTTCLTLDLGLSCMGDDDCTGLARCDGRPCECFDYGQGPSCVTFPSCVDICELGAGGPSTCRSDRSICRPHPFLDIGVCVNRPLVVNLGTGSAGVGEECPMGTECDGDESLQCVGAPVDPTLTIYPNGYCTTFCREGDCPAGSVCSILPGDNVGICAATCAGPGTCAAAGTECLMENGEMVCIPVAPIFEETFDGFNGIAAQALPGWGFDDGFGGTAERWSVGMNTDGTSFNGSNYLFADTFLPAEQLNEIIFTPPIAIPVGGATLRFASQLYDFPGQLVGLVTCAEPCAAPYTDLPASIPDSGPAGPWQSVTVPLPAGTYGGQTIRIGFGYNGADHTYWHVDNVVVD